MVEAGAKEVDEETMLEALQIAHEEIRRPLRRPARAAEAGRQAEVGGRRRRRRREARSPRSRRPSARTSPRPPASRPSWLRRDKVAAVRAAAAEKILGAEPTTRRSPPPSAAPSTRCRRGSSASASRSTSSAPTAATPTRSGRSPPRPRVLPRVHGSGLFTRGETQVLTSLALGTTKEAQRIDGLGIETTKRYIHHYNFPPFSVGETGFMRGPKRRDIGHGALAERALLPMIPDEVEFPYTLRLVSETLESNGSSSMASVCGSTLALLDAGVHDHAPGGRHRDGPHQGGRRLHRPLRHPGRRGPPRRHGLQGGRALARASPPCRWTSRSPASPSTSCATRSPRRRPAASTSSGSWPRRSTPPARSCRRGRRASPRSRSTPSGSAPSSARAARRSAASRPTTRSRSRSRTTARSRSTASTAQKADAAVEQIRAMTKDVEVGDTYTGREGRQDDHVRRVRRAHQGRGRPAAHLEPRPRPGGEGGGRRQPRRHRGRHGGRGGQGPRPDRPAHRRHGGRGRRRGRLRQRRVRRRRGRRRRPAAAAGADG